MRSLVSPSKPGDKTLEELFRVLKEHYNPTPLEKVQWFKFHSQVRHKVGYVFILLSNSKSLAEYCNFSQNLDNSSEIKLSAELMMIIFSFFF